MECGEDGGSIDDEKFFDSRAVEVEVDDDLYEAFRQASEDYWSLYRKVAELGYGVVERERQAKYEAWKARNPGYIPPTGLSGLVQAAYDKLIDFQLRTRSLNKDIT